MPPIQEGAISLHLSTLATHRTHPKNSLYEHDYSLTTLRPAVRMELALHSHV